MLLESVFCRSMASHPNSVEDSLRKARTKTDGVVVVASWRLTQREDGTMLVVSALSFGPISDKKLEFVCRRNKFGTPIDPSCYSLG